MKSLVKLYYQINIFMHIFHNIVLLLCCISVMMHNYMHHRKIICFYMYNHELGITDMDLDLGKWVGLV